jgi:hypothetical protein
VTSPLRRRTIFTLAGLSLLVGLRSNLTSMNFSVRVPRRLLQPLRRRPRIAPLLVDFPPYNTPRGIRRLYRIDGMHDATWKALVHRLEAYSPNVGKDDRLEEATIEGMAVA